jgi:signal recognition particle receptor subunit beta
VTHRDTIADVLLDFAAREVTIKLVYYGPALSGKTTNLSSLHGHAGAESRGRLMTLETQNDRTLFFDLLPLTFRSREGDIALRIKLFAVPGQPVHTATRKLVLQGADGVTFVADSQTSQTQVNADSFIDLRANLKANGLELSKMPLVIQFNKRDLSDVRTEQELGELARRGKEPVFLATARDGFGVVETFVGLLELTLRSLERTHQLAARIGLDAPALLDRVASQLGSREPASRLLATCMGGDFQTKAAKFA